MNIIVPCCGESTRFKGLKKQFLTHPIGLPLPIYSAHGLYGNNFFTFVFIEEEFIDRYSNSGHFVSQLSKVGLHGQVLLLPEKTNSQIETVTKAFSWIEGPFYVKDCDNFFNVTPKPNTVATIHSNSGTYNLDNKSYSRGNPITEIKERAMISPNFNVGGYGFESKEQFRRNMEGCLSISGVIQNCIDRDNTKFYQETAENYEDYGTLKDWSNYLSKFE